MIKTSRGWLLTAASVFALGLGLSALPTFAAAAAPVSTSAPAPASAPAAAACTDNCYNYANIRNSANSRATMKICRNWGPTSCDNGIGYLSAGQQSETKYNWHDTDGYYIPGDMKALESTSDFSVAYYGPQWRKKGGCFGCTHTIILQWR